MSSLSQLSQQYSPIALKLAKSRGVRMLTLGIGLFVALRRLNGWLSWRKANNGVTRKMWHAEKEIIVVTGGSSGIGETIVQLLEERNIKVIILDINAPARKLGHRTAFYEIDLSDSDAIATIAGQIRSQHGNPTVLVNNAGFANGESLISMTPEKLHRIFNVNLAAPFLLVREFLPDMVSANYGHIVNVSSLASFFTQALNVDYCATKAGVLALHEGILQELKYVHNAPAVRATVVHPKWVKTAMCEKLIGTGKLGAHVTAHDVASAVVSQVTSGYGGQLIVPPGMGWTSIVRGLPAWIQEIARDAVSQEYVGALQHLS